MFSKKNHDVNLILNWQENIKKKKKRKTKIDKNG